MNKQQLPYLWIFLPLFLAYVGNILGGYFTLLGIGLVAILTVLDFFWTTKNDIDTVDNRGFSNQILFGVAFFQVMLLISFVWSTYFGIITGVWYFGAILSTGFACAMAASAGAHELIHRRSDLERNIGAMQMGLLFYGHHIIEHIQGHHRHVATDEDPSSPAKGTNFYTYLIKGYIAEVKHGFAFESARLIKKNKSVYTFENVVFRWWMFNLLILILVAFFGFWAFLGYVLISAIFIFFHAAVVYSQHYGLRKEDGDRVNDTHSWQTNSLITQYFLLGFGNHSDHHTRVTKTYTEIIQKETGPMMPFGYLASVVVAMIPFLWFKIVDKRL
jgi:alkane 1-monooxygenase